MRRLRERRGVARRARALRLDRARACTAIHDQPDGRNINAGAGSTHVARLVETVLDVGADLGLALDGDADRLIAVDAEGTVRDGDDLMVLFALDRLERGGSAAASSSPR